MLGEPARKVRSTFAKFSGLCATNVRQIDIMRTYSDLIGLMRAFGVRNAGYP